MVIIQPLAQHAQTHCSKKTLQRSKWNEMDMSLMHMRMKKWKPSHNSQNLWSFILKTVPCRHFSLLRKRHLLGRLSCYPGWAAGSGAGRQWMVAWESDRKLGWNVSSLKGSKRIFQGSRKVLDGAKLGNSVIKRSKTMWDSSPDWLKAKITINPCQLSISDGLLDDFL